MVQPLRPPAGSPDSASVRFATLKIRPAADRRDVVCDHPTLGLGPAFRVDVLVHGLARFAAILGCQGEIKWLSKLKKNRA
jgi:hypothetical protein